MANAYHRWMAGLLPQMSLEPAPGYCRFVERHFEALRRDARRLAGEGNGPDVDEVCADVLADVALRWRWFELLRVRLRRSDPAGAYLGVALARRIARWRPDEPETDDDTPREVQVEAASGPPVWPTAAWYPDDRYAVDISPPEPATKAPAATSAAVRIAAVRPLPTPTPSPQVEAVIAWLHAYATYEKHRRVVAGAAAVVVAAALVKFRGG
jgi:hypothetical protein